MRYAKIRKMDISNGEGIRVSLFVQGCDFHCKNCFNQETWDFNKGKEFFKETLSTLLKLCEKPEIKGLSILGGEPLHNNNKEVVLKITNQFRKEFPTKDIWLWSGFIFENAIQDPIKKQIFQNIDIFIDGQYIDELHNFKLKWKGSSNQRVIDMKETLKQNKIILYER